VTIRVYGQARVGIKCVRDSAMVVFGSSPGVDVRGQDIGP